MTQLEGRTTLPYVAAIDGLRALAVLAVVAYHATMPEVPGGFFGVDVFFVISGYLVTVLFLARSSRHVAGVPIPQTADTLDFWLRRARRLVPATVAAGVVTWVVFVALGVRDAGSLTAEGLAAVGYVGNWYSLFSDHSYFETISSPSPFLHFWSLAVEAQFYLVWPLLLIVALKFGGRLAAFALALSLAAVSTMVVANLYSPETDPSRAYYGTDARAAGLLLGAALAIVVRPTVAAGIPRFFVEIIGWAGVAALVHLVTQTSEFDPFIYRGGFFLVSCATLLVMLAALHGRNTVAWSLSRPALQWIGVRSYSIYLWHWPVFVLSQPHLSSDLGSYSLLAARLGVTLILADLSYRLVENAFRGRSGFRWPHFDLGSGPLLQRPWVRPAGVMAVGLVAVVASGGLPLRIGLANELAAIEQQVQGGGAGGTEQGVPSSEELASAITTPDPAPTPSESSDGATVTPEAPSSSSPTSTATSEPSRTSTPTRTPDPTEPPLVAAPTIETSEEIAPSIPQDPTPDSETPSATSEATTEPTTGPTLEPTPDVSVPGSASSASSDDGDGVAATTPSTTPSADALGASVTVIGDSVALGALGALEAALPGAVVDAEVGRQFWSAAEVIAGLEAQGALGDVVVMSLGANGTFTGGQFSEIMAALGDRTVLFVTVTVPRRWESDVNSAIAQQSQAYGFGVIDWHAISAGVPDYFGADGVHLTEAGRAAYASLIAQAVQAAIAG